MSSRKFRAEELVDELAVLCYSVVMNEEQSIPTSVRLLPESEKIVNRVRAEIPSMSRSDVINTAIVGFYGNKPLTYYTASADLQSGSTSPVAAITWAATRSVNDPDNAPAPTWPPPRRRFTKGGR